MKRRVLEPGIAAAAAVLAIAGAWAGYSGLAALARPAGLNADLERIRASIAKVEAAPRQGGDVSFYAPGAVCHDPPGRAADALRARLAAAAAGAGLAPPKITLADTGAPDVTQPLAPVIFQLETSGRYDQVIAYFRRLSEAGPQIFADSVDLRSQVSSVSLKLTGRVLCSTSAA
jgi:hypothetical protein